MAKKLATYAKRRNVKKSGEPRARVKSSTGNPVFVVQKHKATRLHYDFRLEIDGVLKSWAIPKGPSLNPKDKRLAVLTDDHPLSYKNFEGVIPKGEYGAGPVLVWDRGRYRNLKDISLKSCFRKGLIEVFLKGKKLKGGFALVRMEGENWLFIKKKDEYADLRKNITSSEPNSVKSGKKIEQLR